MFSYIGLGLMVLDVGCKAGGTGLSRQSPYLIWKNLIAALVSTPRAWPPASSGATKTDTTVMLHHGCHRFSVMYSD